MKVFTDFSAYLIFKSEAFPNNSIGVFLALDTWVYWFYEGNLLDIGYAPTEKEAFAKAKMNLK
jgi:hypothetical protein